MEPRGSFGSVGSEPSGVTTGQPSVVLRIIGSLSRLSWVQRALLVAGYAAVAATFDLAFSPELGAGCVWLVPVAFATCAFGLPLGVAMAIVSVASVWGVELGGVYPYPSAASAAWSAAARTISGGAVVWLAREVALAYQQLVRCSERDALTGLYNRRGFAKVADAELRRSRRYGRPISVAFLDIDDFKSVNDSRGHLEGDRVLVQFAQSLGDGRRAFDVAARLGGDEFVLLMPETHSEAAKAAMRRLQGLATEALAKEDPPITFTTGLVTFEEAPADIDTLIESADRLLRDGKRAQKSTIESMIVRHADPRGRSALRVVKSPR